MPRIPSANENVRLSKNQLGNITSPESARQAGDTLARFGQEVSSSASKIGSFFAAKEKGKDKLDAAEILAQFRLDADRSASFVQDPKKNKEMAEDGGNILGQYEDDHEARLENALQGVSSESVKQQVRIGALGVQREHSKLIDLTANKMALSNGVVQTERVIQKHAASVLSGTSVDDANGRSAEALHDNPFFGPVDSALALRAAVQNNSRARVTHLFNENAYSQAIAEIASGDLALSEKEAGELTGEAKIKRRRFKTQQVTDREDRYRVRERAKKENRETRYKDRVVEYEVLKKSDKSVITNRDELMAEMIARNDIDEQLGKVPKGSTARMRNSGKHEDFFSSKFAEEDLAGMLSSGTATGGEMRQRIQELRPELTVEAEIRWNSIASGLSKQNNDPHRRAIISAQVKAIKAALKKKRMNPKRVKQTRDAVVLYYKKIREAGFDADLTDNAIADSVIVSAIGHLGSAPRIGSIKAADGTDLLARDVAEIKVYMIRLLELKKQGAISEKEALDKMNVLAERMDAAQLDEKRKSEKDVKNGKR